MTAGVISGPVRCGTMGIHMYYKWKGKLVQLLWNMVFYYLSKVLVVKNLLAKAGDVFDPWVRKIS